MEEMKKDENLEAQEAVVEETVEETMETVEAEAVEEGEMEVLDEKDEKIAQLEQQAADNLDKYQRCLAEFDNFRKRTVKEKASMYDDGIRSTVEKLLMVIDNLERAVAVQEGKVDENDAFFKGVKMTLTQFQDVLRGIGVEEIKAVGEKFDPNLHAAVAHEDDENYGENEVVLEMLKDAESNMSAGHARALLGLTNSEDIVNAAQAVVSRELSVRATEALVKTLNNQAAIKAKEVQPVPEKIRVNYCAELEKRVEDVIGRKVKITGKGQTKRIEISFSSNEDLEELLKMLCGDEFFEDI